MILCLAFKSQTSFYDLNIQSDMNKIRQTMGHYGNRFGYEWPSTTLMEAKH